jgi:hypothetical protein
MSHGLRNRFIDAFFRFVLSVDSVFCVPGKRRRSSGILSHPATVNSIRHGLVSGRRTSIAESDGCLADRLQSISPNPTYRSRRTTTDTESRIETTSSRQVQGIKIVNVSKTIVLIAAIMSVSAAPAQSAAHPEEFHSEGPAVKAAINGPRGLALYESRFLYVAEAFRNVIRRVDLVTGTIATLAVNSKLDDLGGIAVDPSGDLIITEFTAKRVRKIHPTDGTVSLLADGLSRPDFVTTDGGGNIYIADLGCILRLEAKTGSMMTVVAGDRASTGQHGPAIVGGYFSSVAVDHEGNLFVSEYGNRGEGHRVFRVDGKTRIIQTIAGLARAGLTGDGGLAVSANVQSPSNLLLDRNGDLFVIDPVNDRIRRIDAKTGVITTVAGSTKGFGGDGGLKPLYR